MRKLAWLASAAIGLGSLSMVASPALADRWDWRDRHDYRRHYDYDDYGPAYGPTYGPAYGNVDQDISISQVPGWVLRTADAYRRGRPIEAIQYVNRYGHVFYRFRIEGYRAPDFNIRVSPNGDLLGIETAGPEEPYSLRR